MQKKANQVEQDLDDVMNDFNTSKTDRKKAEARLKKVGGVTCIIVNQIVFSDGTMSEQELLLKFLHPSTPLQIKDDLAQFRDDFDAIPPVNDKVEELRVI